MKYVPHDYQDYAREFMERHPISAIFLDCGLGKTVITLTAIHNLMFDAFRVHSVLVVAPLRVAKTTWPDEIRKWDHVKDFTFAVAAGSEAERKRALNKKADITIINRENLKWLIEESGIPFDYDMLVLDELSSFKNHQAKRFKALMKVRPKVKIITGLTGTPSSNGLMDLFAEFKVLDMGKRLGRFITSYRAEYFLPDRMNGQVVYSYKPRPGAEEKIYKKISDITISMTAAEHLKMPDLLETSCKVKLTEAEWKKYEELKKDLVLQLPEGEVTAANAAALSGKLLQMAGGAVYLDDERMVRIHDEKLDALEDLIEAQNDKPLLVAYWYRHEYDRIAERLGKRKISFAKLDTEESIRRWNRKEIPVALIHPASSGHGLNLQEGGSTMVWFSLPWSLELYQQTVARLYRQGQKEKTVVIIHLLTEGTIDERVLKAIKKKHVTQEKLIDAVRADLGR
jgi:SNF2 family DNA or RNA helicase